MSISILLSILFELLENRRVTANVLSQKHGISNRTVYRYVEKLSPFLPLFVKRGRGGGVELAESFKLPVDFLTAEEYEATVDALCQAYVQTPEERFLSAKRKLSNQARESAKERAVRGDLDEILLFPSSEKSELLRLAETGVREKRIARVLFGEKELSVEPHNLLYYQDDWYLCAFCYTSRAFLPLPLSKIRGISLSEHPFRPRHLEVDSLLSRIPCTS